MTGFEIVFIPSSPQNIRSFQRLVLGKTVSLGTQKRWPCIARGSRVAMVYSRLIMPSRQMEEIHVPQCLLKSSNCYLIHNKHEERVSIRVRQSPASLVVRKPDNSRSFEVALADIITTDDVVLDVSKRKWKSKIRNAVLIQTNKSCFALSGGNTPELRVLIEKYIASEVYEGQQRHTTLDHVEETDLPVGILSPHSPEEERVIIESPEARNIECKCSQIKSHLTDEKCIASKVLPVQQRKIIASVMHGDALTYALEQMGCAIETVKRDKGSLVLTHTVPTGLPVPRYIMCTQVISVADSPLTLASHVNAIGHRWANWMDAEWGIEVHDLGYGTRLDLHYSYVKKQHKPVKIVSKLVQDFVEEAYSRTIDKIEEDTKLALAAPRQDNRSNQSELSRELSEQLQKPIRSDEEDSLRNGTNAPPPVEQEDRFETYEKSTQASGSVPAPRHKVYLAISVCVAILSVFIVWAFRRE